MGIVFFFLCSTCSKVWGCFHFHHLFYMCIYIYIKSYI
jgi:hypothetical protein